MKPSLKLLFGMMIAVCIWLILVSVLSVAANGWLYRIEQPVPVVNIFVGGVELEFERFARCELDIEYTNWVICDSRTHKIAGRQRWKVKRGRGKYRTTFFLPQGCEGRCTMFGFVHYKPLGPIAPSITYRWESEPFVLPGSF